MQQRRVNVDCEAKIFISALFTLAIVKQMKQRTGKSYNFIPKFYQVTIKTEFFNIYIMHLSKISLFFLLCKLGHFLKKRNFVGCHARFPPNGLKGN